MAYEDTSDEDTGDEFNSESLIRENTSIGMSEAWMLAAGAIHRRQCTQEIVPSDFLLIKHKVFGAFSLVSSRGEWPDNSVLTANILGSNSEDDQNTQKVLRDVQAAFQIVRRIYDDPARPRLRAEVLSEIRAQINQLQPAV